MSDRRQLAVLVEDECGGKGNKACNYGVHHSAYLQKRMIDEPDRVFYNYTSSYIEKDWLHRYD